MFWAKALSRAGVGGWPLLIVAIVPLTGCAGIKFPSFTTSANEGPAQVASGDAGAMLKLARATRQAGDFPAAIQLYRNVIATNSATPDILVEFGDVLLASGSPDDAIDIYSRIGARSAARLGALLGLTRAYMNLSQPAKALEYTNEARVLEPQDARVLVDRGVALDTLGRHTEAQECYRTVLAGTPRHVAARNNLALSLALTGQYEEAIALMAPLVRSSAATPQVRENMAVIYGLKGDADRAATLSRVDLDEGTTQANLAFLAAVHGTKP